MNYRIDLIHEEGKPDLFQPQIKIEYKTLNQEGIVDWYNLIRIGNIVNFVKPRTEFTYVHRNDYDHQAWETEAEARKIIELHKKQSEQNITHTYIEVN